MTDIKALDKLRRAVKKGKAGAYESGKAYYDAIDECMDAIEREVSERFVELPVDEDGITIHVGDMVQGLGDSGPVQHLELWDDGWVVVFEFAPGQFTRYSGDAVRHVKPRTVEDVLGEAVGELFNADISTGSTEWDEVIARYAAEIREVLGVEK